jgi:hypothetical protein
MRILFLILLTGSLLAVPCGMIALFESPIHAVAILIPSFIYLGAFTIAYVLDETGEFNDKRIKKR